MKPTFLALAALTVLASAGQHRAAAQEKYVTIESQIDGGKWCLTVKADNENLQLAHVLPVDNVGARNQVWVEVKSEDGSVFLKNVGASEAKKKDMVLVMAAVQARGVNKVAPRYQPDNTEQKDPNFRWISLSSYNDAYYHQLRTWNPDEEQYLNVEGNGPYNEDTQIICHDGDGVNARWRLVPYPPPTVQTKEPTVWRFDEVVVLDSKTGQAPALAAFNDRLYLVHRGTGGNNNIHVTSSADGWTWNAEQVILDEKCDGAPALAVFNQKLYMVHRGREGNQNIFVTSTADGVNWDASVVILDYKCEDGPALAVFKERLYLAHRGRGGNDNIFVTSTGDGKAWSGEQVIGDYKSEVGPALEVFKDRLYLAHRGTGGNTNLFITSTADGTAWSEETVIEDYKSEASPALMSYKDRLHLLHRGKGGNHTIFDVYTDDGVHWAEQWIGDGQSEVGPRAAVFNDRLFTAHRGKGGNDNIFVTSAAAHPFVEADAIPFEGTDVRRIALNLNELPHGWNGSFLIEKNGLPAQYTEVFGYKLEHLQYVMRLNVTDPSGAAYFLVTHSQREGGWVAVAKVDGQFVGKGDKQHQITLPESEGFAGEIVWWDHLTNEHRSGGCNHPGDSGQVGSIVVIAGQDWKDDTANFAGLSRVGNGDAVLFYDFSNPLLLKKGSAPYLGCLKAKDLGLWGDGQMSGAGIEQGPDGMYYLYAGAPGSMVVWKASRPHPDAEWTRVFYYGPYALSDGAGGVKWSQTLDNKAGSALYSNASSDNGMNYLKLTYEWDAARKQVVGVRVTWPPVTVAHDEHFGGKDDWVADNGSIYTSPTGAVAMYGAWKSMNDEKPGKDGEMKEALQIRQWYGPPR